MPKTAGIICQQYASTVSESNESNFCEEKSQIKTKIILTNKANGVVRLNNAMYLIVVGLITEATWQRMSHTIAARLVSSIAFRKNLPKRLFDFLAKG